jgi:cysteinyl-tRNA synthetase
LSEARGTEATRSAAAEIEALLVERTEARAAKDFARADAIRAELDARGIVIEDTPQGARWSVKR